MPKGCYIRTDIRVLSEETKKKIGDTLRGKPRPQCGRPGVKVPSRGRPGTKRPPDAVRRGAAAQMLPVHLLADKQSSLHRRLIQLYGRADHCESASCTKKSTLYEWSRKNHSINTLDRSDWQQLCKSCHYIYDRDVHGSRKGMGRS